MQVEKRDPPPPPPLSVGDTGAGIVLVLGCCTTQQHWLPGCHTDGANSGVSELTVNTTAPLAYSGAASHTEQRIQKLQTNVDTYILIRYTDTNIHIRYKDTYILIRYTDTYLHLYYIYAIRTIISYFTLTVLGLEMTLKDNIDLILNDLTLFFSSLNKRLISESEV